MLPVFHRFELHLSVMLSERLLLWWKTFHLISLSYCLLKQWTSVNV